MAIEVFAASVPVFVNTLADMRSWLKKMPTEKAKPNRWRRGLPGASDVDLEAATPTTRQYR